MGQGRGEIGEGTLTRSDVGGRDARSWGEGTRYSERDGGQGIGS